ncbi:MAG: hypothetical protein ACK55I_18780, partial [bacterium]
MHDFLDSGHQESQPFGGAFLEQLLCVVIGNIDIGLHTCCGLDRRILYPRLLVCTQEMTPFLYRLSDPL